MRRRRATATLAVITTLLITVTVANVGLGAVPIAPLEVVAILASRAGIDLPVAYTAQQESVLWAIRLPRVVLGALVGAGLAVSGAALQGLFRNPLADPGLIGVSSGAAVGAAGMIVLGVAPIGLATVPIAAFAGGLLAVAVVFAAARRGGRTDVVALLLCGIAVNAIAAACVGLLILIADDAQLRGIVFWSLGSVGGASWSAVASALPLVVLALVVLPLFARPLDILTLGEREAAHLGISPDRVRAGVVVLAALATGATVAVAGIVGFVGLVVPHLVRLVAGPGHRLLIPASALGGATLLLAADLAARTLIVPAEIPLGTVTALVGGPFFLWLVIRTTQRARA